MPDTNPNRWLILGSSPSMPLFADREFNAKKPNVIATTNAGIYECMHQNRYPNYYAVMETETEVRYGRYYRRARAQGGTAIVTIPRTLKRFEKRGLDPLDYDINLKSAYHLREPDGRYRRCDYVLCGMTGVMMLQLAIAKGATEIALIGMEGYVSGSEPTVDSFDGRLGVKDGKVLSDRCANLIQQIVSACPDVLFEFYGDLTYAVVGPNVYTEGTKNQHIAKDGTDESHERQTGPVQG